MIKNKVDIDKNIIVDILNGTLYNQFYYLFQSKFTKNNEINYEMLRDYTKKSFFKNLLYGFNTHSRLNKEFKIRYPKTHSFLFNETDKTKLCNELQNLETIMINLDIKYSKYTYPLHDCIYFNNKKDVSLLKKQLYNFFKEYNIRPILEVE